MAAMARLGLRAVELFSRRTVPRGADRQRTAISEFWQWWTASGAAETAAAIENQTPERVAARISRRVERIDRRLGWELAAGLTSRHVLVVTPEGDPGLRAAARRWRRAAPDPDRVWQYADARPPAADLDGVTLQVEGITLDVALTTLVVRMSGAALDVGVHHPRFAGLPEQARTTAAFLILDQALGEADVETWIGTVDVIVHPPLDPLPLAGLPSVVRDLRAMHTDVDGAPAWVLLQGHGHDGLPVMACAQVPLRPAVAPHLDVHVRLDVAFTNAEPSGFPDPEALRHLRHLEDHLQRRLGESGHIVAHETHAGHRLFHVYVDSTTPAVEQLRAALAGWDQGRVRLGSRADPGWKGVSHLAGP
jgi:hypothetical protein